MNGATSSNLPELGDVPKESVATDQEAADNNRDSGKCAPVERPQVIQVLADGNQMDKLQL